MSSKRAETAPAWRAICFAGEPNRWSRIGTLHIPQRESSARETLHERLREQPPVPVAPRFADVKIGDVTLRFQPSDD